MSCHVMSCHPIHCKRLLFITDGSPIFHPYTSLNQPTGLNPSTDPSIHIDSPNTAAAHCWSLASPPVGESCPDFSSLPLHICSFRVLKKSDQYENEFHKVGRCLARYSPRAEANNTIPCNTIWDNAMTCKTMQYHKMQCNTMQYHTMPCDTME